MVNKKRKLPGKGGNNELHCYDNKAMISEFGNGTEKSAFENGGEYDKSAMEYSVKLSKICPTTEENPAPTSFISLFRHSDVSDKLLILLGIIGAIVHGVSSPFMVIVFGELADSFVRYSSCIGVAGEPRIRNISTTNCSQYANLETNETGGSEDLTTQMAYFAVYYLICSAVVLVCGFLQVFSLSMSANRQSRRIRYLLFRSIIYQEREWIDSREAHEVNTKLDRDVAKISEVIGDKTGCFVQCLSASAFGLGIGFYYEWRLTFVILAAAPVLAGATVLMGKFHNIWCEKEAKAYSKAGSIVESVLKNIRTVVAYGAEELEVNRYDERLAEAKKIGIKKGVMRGGFQGVIWCALILTFALAFWYGSILVLNNQNGFTLGKLLTVFLSIMYAVSSLGHAASIADSIFSAKSTARSIFDIIDKKSNIDSSLVAEEDYETRGHISLENVSFCYPNREKHAVLSQYYANLSPGKIYAIKGPSGSGKSTVLKLIQRMYDPKRGKIILDGHDIKNLNVNWLRSLMGVVTQEPMLFATTIMDNIKLGCDRASDNDAIEAAKAANAYDFVMALPQQFETLVGNQGCQLSGGQKQRIAIARALVRKPKILLLDQPCSALDTHSESRVLDALREGRLARTTIIVTHKPSTIRIADHVLETKHDGCLGKSLKDRHKSARSSRVKSVDACRMIEFLAKHNGNRKDSFDSESSLEDPSWVSACETETGESDDGSNDVNDRKRQTGVTTRRILSLNRPEWPLFAIGSFAALLNGATQPLFAVILSAVIGAHVLPDDSEKRQSINLYCILMAGLGAVTFFVYLVQHGVFAFSGEALTRRLRKMAFGAILRQEMSFFDEHTKKSCSLPYLLAYHVPQVQGLSGTLIGIVVCTTTTVLLALAITLYSGWQLALLQLACFPIIVASHALDSKMHGNTVRDQRHIEEGGEIVLEALNSHETVVHLGKEDYFLSKFSAVLSAIARNKRKRSILQGISHGFAHAVTYLTYAATFRLGAYLIEQNDITFENLFRVYFVIVFAGLSIGRNIKHMPDFTLARKSASKIFRIIDRQSAIDAESSSGIEPLNIGNPSGELQLKSCSFKYATRSDCVVLKNLDVSIPMGQTLALVGKSGCGKSTVVQMIERFYDPTDGAVLINGRDVREYNIQFLRSKIGVVFQDPVLFEGTVYENIAYGRNPSNPSAEEVHTAARIANIHDEICRLDKGYDTRLGTGGKGLSRGEKQRIAIARAILRNPPILLLDEATSCLDQENESLVQSALKRAREGRTTIIVAHKLKTIEDADKIAVISGGQVMESGTHQGLMEAQGAYYNMVRTGAALA